MLCSIGPRQRQHCNIGTRGGQSAQARPEPRRVRACVRAGWTISAPTAVTAKPTTPWGECSADINRPFALTSQLHPPPVASEEPHLPPTLRLTRIGCPALARGWRTRRTSPHDSSTLAALALPMRAALAFPRCPFLTSQFHSLVRATGRNAAGPKVEHNSISRQHQMRLQSASFPFVWPTLAIRSLYPAVFPSGLQDDREPSRVF